MSIQPNKKSFLSTSGDSGNAKSSKIAIFYKLLLQKLAFGVSAFMIIFAPATQVNAGFFSSIGEIFGIGVQAEERSLDARNSQNIPLLEPSITPDLRSGAKVRDVVMLDGEALEANTNPMGTSDVEAQYISTQKIQIYKVVAGDTLDTISKKFGVSKNSLVSSNDSLPLKGKLKVGQTIVILPVEGLVYEVKKGDTIEALARKYSTTSKEILKYNNMENASDLQIGDTIVLPGAKKIVAKPAEIKAPSVKAPSEKPAEISAPTQKEEKAEISASSSDAPAASSGYIWPLPLGAGRISQRLHDDNAVDIAAPKGTPIYAIKDGTVLIADDSGWNGGYGLYVVINFDDGGQALYGHMSKVATVAGTVVKQGDLIGYVGTTGLSTGNHVHLSLRGGLKNPYGYLKVNNTSSNFK